MEKFSETPPARKRGRPIFFDPTELSMIDQFAIGGTTKRNRANVAYRQRALSMLMHAKNPEPFKWLWDEDAVNRNQAHGMRSTILSALGRISNDPKVVEAFALRLCEVKPTAAEAVAMLRYIRLTKRGTTGDRRSPSRSTSL